MDDETADRVARTQLSDHQATMRAWLERELRMAPDVAQRYVEMWTAEANRDGRSLGPDFERDGLRRIREWMATAKGPAE